MNVKSIVLSIFLLVVQLGFSQSEITGKVLDSNNAAIEGANVVLTNDSQQRKGATTDSDGNFSIEVGESSTYNIRISFIGYESYTKNLSISDSKNLGSITLVESTEALQSVEVIGRKRQDYNSDYSFSATKVAIKNKELPQAVATVTKELISDRLAFQLPDAVKTVSNVSATGIYNHYNIRGITQADDGQILNGMRTRQYYFLQLRHILNV